MPKFYLAGWMVLSSSSPFVRRSWWLLPLFCVLGIFAPAVFAREPDCQTIESTGGRLACYDATFPPRVKKPAVVANDASRAVLEDPFAAEEASTAAKLRNICRGC